MKNFTVHRHLESYGFINLGWKGDEVEKEYPMTFKQACYIARTYSGYIVELI